MKAREPRRKVLIRARMCLGIRWSDVCILNISSRGMLLQAAAPPSEGTYVEVRRGSHVIIARVVWTKNHRFGVRTQDPLVVNLVVNEPDFSSGPGSGGSAERPSIERRSAPRPPQLRYEDSKTLSRTIEFAALASFAVGGAVLAFQAVEEVLAQPLTNVSRVLQ